MSDEGLWQWVVAAQDLGRLVAVLGGDPGADLLDLEQRYTGPGSHELERLLRDGDVSAKFVRYGG